jgi:hypothetical protein
MVYRGHVQNGVVILDDPCPLPEGTEVQVNVPPRESPAPPRETASLFDRLASLVGAAEGLPPDLSANHDHYLYGTPKRT